MSLFHNVISLSGRNNSYFKGMPLTGADKLGLPHTVRCIKLPLAAFTSFTGYFFPAGLGGICPY